MSWQEAVERGVHALGYELVDVERSAGGLLRVFIDRVAGRSYESGTGDAVTVDDCERVTRHLQYALEVDDVDYARLEVSSPGLDRPLRKAADWERFAGSEVDCHAALAVPGPQALARPTAAARSGLASGVAARCRQPDRGTRFRSERGA